MPGIIKINPSVFEDNRDALASAWNEGLRLVMEDMKFTPVFEVTPEQKAFFKDTAYATNALALKRTIVARIATMDTSVSPTEEQEGETIRLLTLVAEMLGAQHPDTQVVQKMAESVQAGNARGDVRGAPQPGEGVPGEAQEGAPEEAQEGAQEGAPEEAPEGEALEGEAPAGQGGPPMLDQAAAAGGDARTDTRTDPPKSKSVKARALNYVKGAQPDMEAVVDRVVDALVPAEGNAGNDTVGDKGKALGSLQMWGIAVEEANRIVGRDLWKLEDRRDPTLARAMAKTTLSYHYRRGTTDPVELGAKWRNPFGEEAPDWYKEKIRKALKALDSKKLTP